MGKQELKDMGVQILGHQGLLMTEIEKLKLKRNVTRGMDTSEMVERDGASFAAKSGAYGTYSTNTQYLFNMHGVNMQNQHSNVVPPPPPSSNSSYNVPYAQ